MKESANGLVEVDEELIQKALELKKLYPEKWSTTFLKLKFHICTRVMNELYRAVELREQEESHE